MINIDNRFDVANSSILIKRIRFYVVLLDHTIYHIAKA